MDIKDVPSKFFERLQSRFFSAFVIAFMAVNWKPLFFLIFASKQNVMDRIGFFEKNVDASSLFLWPLAAAIFLSIILPFLNAGLEELNLKAFERVEKEKQRQANERALVQLDHEAQLTNKRNELDEAQAKERALREEELIAQAKRDQEAMKIENDALREKLEREIEKSRLSVDELVPFAWSIYKLRKIMSSGVLATDGPLISELLEELEALEKDAPLAERTERFLQLSPAIQRWLDKYPLR